MVIEEEEVNSMRSPDEWDEHILSGLRDPLEACLLDARRESLSPKGDVQSHSEENQMDKVNERGNKGEAQPIVEELTHIKEIVSELMETQVADHAATSSKDRAMDSNEGLIKEYAVATEVKRKRKDEKEVTPLMRKKKKVSQRSKKSIEPARKAAKDKESGNEEQANSPESTLQHPLTGLLKKWRRRG